MRWTFTALTLTLGATVVAAQSSNNTSSVATTTASNDPCAVLSSKAKASVSALPQAALIPLVPSDVYACLRTVPYDKSKDAEQIAWLQEVLQLQSTLAYLKDPPPAYPLPAVDLIGGVNNISNSIASGEYTNEYDIELDLYTLIDSAEDGHLTYNPYLLTTFPWIRSFHLFSVSLDGVKAPKIYISTDIPGLINGSSTPSAVTSIDGQDVTYLTHYGFGMQDLDALYNSALDTPATANVVNNGVGAITAGRITQARDNTSITFENGTTTVLNASIYVDRSQATAIPDSGAGFSKLLTPTKPDSTAPPPNPAPEHSNQPLGPTYPWPVEKHFYNFVSGYFMNDTGNTDVAVLNVASFDAKPHGNLTEFQDVGTRFLNKCQAAGKTRLIVDIRNNPGGRIQLGYWLFGQLFPSKIPYSGIRFRASEAINLIGQIASADVAKNGDESYYDTSAATYQEQLQETNGPSYTSWQQFYGPLHQHSDLFSNIGAWADYSSQSQADINGNILAQPFARENIILLTDGLCSSTCADFANLMINQGNVTTVTVGGRPNGQPMAVVGGVQGAQIFRAEDFPQFFGTAIQLQENNTGYSSPQAAEARRMFGRLAKQPPLFPDVTGAVSVNLLDNIAQNDSSVTPLQFSGGVAADCRMYYMPADILSMANTWSRVAKGIKAGGKSLCVNGTIGSSSQITHLTNGTMGSVPVDSNTTGGNYSVGSAINQPFLGSASILGGTNLGWTFVSMAFAAFFITWL